MKSDELKDYENFVETHPDGTIFQSGFFGKFQEKIPYRGKVMEVTIKNVDGKIKASCLVVRQKMPLGYSWLWIPYGPLLALEDGDSEEAMFIEIFEEIEAIAQAERAVFTRIEPIHEFDIHQAKYLSKEYPIRKSHRRYTPEHTLILNLHDDEDALLVQMKPKGRYNIKVAQKNGVEVSRYNDFKEIPEKDFDAFYEILRSTGERDDFGIHPRDFYASLLKNLSGKSSLFLAYAPSDTKEKKVIAGIIVTYYKDTATYYYGASSYENRNLMAPYLLQWEAIKEATKRGFKTYDFLGISPPDVKNHSWAGVTDFKEKFGGKRKKFPPAFLIVHKPFLFRLLTKILSRRY